MQDGEVEVKPGVCQHLMRCSRGITSQVATTVKFNVVPHPVVLKAIITVALNSSFTVMLLVQSMKATPVSHCGYGGSLPFFQ